MKLNRLFRDELTGFYRSSVMVAMWVGLPIIGAVLYILNPNTEPELPFSALFASVVSGLGGTLASIMISVHLIHEKSQHVYELFLVRPVPRREILWAKFLAVFVCVAVASIVSLALGVILDMIFHGGPAYIVTTRPLEAMISSMSTIAVACSVGVLIGVLAPTVLLGIVLIVFVSGNISALVVLLPAMLKLPNPFAYSLLFGAIVSAACMITAIKIFNRIRF
jgi:ABC-type transport system involved in multi-copper enzyme maturation permease subunit